VEAFFGYPQAYNVSNFLDSTTLYVYSQAEVWGYTMNVTAIVYGPYSDAAVDDPALVVVPLSTTVWLSKGDMGIH
jgi:hypothetical protein